MEQKAKLGFWSIVLLTINSIIGTGIFLSPGGVAKQSGGMAPFIYICAAVFAIMLALTFASASKYTRESGAAYAYVRTAFGDNAGLYVGITRFVSASIAWGVMATGVIKTAFQILGYSSEEITFGMQTVGFIILMIVLFVVNVLGTKIFTWVSNLSTIGKCVALVIAILAGIIVAMKTGNHMAEINELVNDAGEKVVPQMTSAGFVTALVAAFYAFTGFESVASGASDMEEPEKNLPRAIPVAIGIVAAIYFGIILTAMLIDPVAMVTSSSVVVLADVFKNALIRNIIIIGAFVSMFGINVASSFHTPRLLEAMALRKQVPDLFSKRNAKDIPVNAFIITAIFAIVIPMAFSYDMKGIMIISTIARFVQFVLVPIAVIMFFYGKTKNPTIEGAKKNYITDVVVSVISLVLTVVLLVKFDWAGSFSTTTDAGTTLNYFAVIAMIIGYIIIPIFVYFYAKANATENANG
ncbi:MAG: APC family permease [Mogibacterium sp.]|nr:APC family permease [Mogibacterium sp.]